MMEITLYKLNLHAHSKFSDGSHSVNSMAMRYKSLGFTCCVLTDHVYSNDAPYSNSLEKYIRQIEEAKKASIENNIPIILGAEFSVSKSEECLVFGQEAILYLLTLRDEKRKRIKTNSIQDLVITYEDLIFVKELFPCAVILAHPMLSPLPCGIIPLKGHLALDGYERFNSCQDFFGDRRDVPEELKDLPSFCNSDAHSMFEIDDCYNVVYENITSEEQLISYIKNKMPVIHVVEEEPSELSTLIMSQKEIGD